MKDMGTRLLLYPALPIEGIRFKRIDNQAALMGEREIVRTSYGMSRPRLDFPRLADLYMEGKLFLDEMMTMRLPLEQINDGFAALEQGNVARALVIFG